MMLFLFLLGLATIALSWFAAFKAWITLYVALYATGGALLLWLGLAVRWTVKRIRAARAKRLEQAINTQAETQANTVRPDLQPEIKAMQAEFNRAVAALKSSKLARDSRDALAVLPWYLLIGPPGAGKSTALRNCGLKFPYLSNRGGGVRGVGGTRNCDWWLSNQAVLLDTAGRYATGDADRDEWLAFLDILAKHRPKRPINGIIIGLSVKELMEMDPQAAGEMGQRIRERMDELTARLRVVVPVYITVTKCDLLPGFTEMFADLPRSERGQIWGFTVPLSAQPEAATELFNERFDELAAVVEQRSLHRIGQERQIEARERIYEFPQRFAALRKNLSELMQVLFMENVFQDTPVMRGVYFTSAIQEAQAPDKVLVSAPSALAEPVEGKSYFLWDLFHQILFQDQKMAMLSSMEELRQRRRRYVVAGAALAAALGLLVLPTVSFFQNRELAQRVHDAVMQVRLDGRDEISRVEDLSPLQAELNVLAKYHIEGAPFWMRFGFYRGEDFFVEARDFYNSALRQMLLGRQFERLSQSLERFQTNVANANWRPESGNYGNDFNDLKMYLLITTPKDPREPALDADQQEWLVRRMVQHWGTLKGVYGEVVKEQTLTRHAQTYIQMMAADPEKLAFTRNPRLVRLARVALNRVPRPQLELDRIINDVDKEYPPMTLGDMVGIVPGMSADASIRGAFTRPAWDQVVRSRMEESFRDTESWVLDRDQKEDQLVSRTKLKTLYYEGYILEWRRFLDSIHVAAPSDLSQTQELLEAVTKGKPAAFGRLFRALANNVQLERTDKGATAPSLSGQLKQLFTKATPAEKEGLVDPSSPLGEEVLGPRNVERAFGGLIKFASVTSPTPDKEEHQTALDFYEDELRRVLDKIVKVREKPTESLGLIEEISTRRQNVVRLLQSQETGGFQLEKLLLPPLHDVRTIVFRGVSGEKSQKWCEEVALPLRSLMDHHYPFDRNAIEDAPLAIVSNYLRPKGGGLRKFHEEQLQKDLLADGRHWKLTADAQRMYRPELLLHMERATALANALFPADQDGVLPQVRFKARIVPATTKSGEPANIASITLTVDGTDVVYQNGPEAWNVLTWPGPEGKLGANIHVKSATLQSGTADIPGEGEWGLFRLLDRAQRLEASADGRRITAVWTLDENPDLEIRIEILPERLVNPFLSPGEASRPLALFRDPAVLPPLGIAQDVKGCTLAPQAVSAGGTSAGNP